MVPRWVFTLLLSLAVLVVGSGFGFFGHEIRTQGDKHSAAIEKMSTVLSGMAETSAVTLYKVGELEKRLPPNPH